MTPAAKKVTLAAANLVYDQKGIDMLHQMLQQTKGAHAITPSVVLACVTLLSQMKQQLQGLSENDMWSKHGVVHATLDALYEVAKHLGYKAPRSDLEKAYKMVFTKLHQVMNAPQQPQGPPQQASPMQGAMPPPSGAAPPVPPQMGAQQ